MRSPIGEFLRVTVVIPHRGNDLSLQRCLAALAVQSYPAAFRETIVVVNETQQRELGFPLHSDVSVLWQTDFYSYAARNLGVRYSSADVIAFTDSDTVPDEDWITEGVSAISTGADIVAGHINLSFTTEPLSAAACYEKLYAFDQQKNTMAGYAATANLFVTKQALERWGLFDQTSRSGEDFEWTRRASEAGAKLVYSRTASVTHPARESMSELLAKARRTTALFVGRSYSSARHRDILATRASHQFFTPPSRSKKLASTRLERGIARTVRSLLATYKALCLLGLSPKFRKEQEKLKRELATAISTKLVRS